MRKKNVTVYTNEMHFELEQYPENNTWQLWTDGDEFDKDKLEELYKFLGEVLVDMGATLQVPEKAVVEAEKVTFAPKNRMFDPNPDKLNM